MKNFFILSVLFVVIVLSLPQGTVQAFEWAKFQVEGLIEPNSPVYIFIIDCSTEGCGVYEDIHQSQNETMVYKTGKYDVNYLTFVRLNADFVSSYKAVFNFWPGADLKKGQALWFDSSGTHNRWINDNPPKDWGKPTLTDFQWRWIKERYSGAVRPAPAYAIPSQGKIAKTWGFVKTSEVGR